MRGATVRRLAVAALLGAAAPAWAGVLPAGMLEKVPPRRFAVDVGGGSLSYVGGEIGGGAGSWSLTTGYTPWPYLTIEAGYLGAAGQAHGGGTLVATLVEGDLRFNPIPGFRFSPYLLAGAGWGGFHESRSASDGETATFPLGVGTEVRLTDRWTFGGRVVYRVVTHDHVGPERMGVDSWSTQLRFGAKF